MAKPSDPPPPGLVPGGNGVLNHLSVVKVFQDLRTCSLRPHPVPPTYLQPHLARTSMSSPFLYFLTSFFDLIFEVVFVVLLATF